MLLKILGNVPGDSRECLRRFQGMFRRFQGMLLKILGNVRADSWESKFWFISWNLACLLPNFAVKLLRNNRRKQLLSNSSKENIFFTRSYN